MEVPIQTECSAIHEIMRRLRRRYEQANSSDPADPRIVFVLGAAASFESDMPSWTDPLLKAEVFETAKRHFREPNDFFEMAWDLLAPELPTLPGAHGKTQKSLLEHATLDMLCSVACMLPPIRFQILNVLKEHFARHDPDAGPPPQLGYELLAHLVKHRYVDSIITFNFDELVDRALDNELGANEYNRIISEHRSLDTLAAHKPHLVKLHGSIGAPDTLRFSRDQVSVLPRSMTSILDRVVLGFDPDTSSSTSRARFSIVSFGYAWNDPDFVHWLKSREADLDHLTTVTIDDPPIRISNAIPQAKRSHINIRGVMAESHEGFDAFMWAVVQSLQEQTRTPVGIARHLVLAHAFRKSCRLTHSRDNRFRAELLLHLLKCKGMVNLSVMARDCRLDRYRPQQQNSTRNYLSQYHEILQKSSVADVTETYFTTASSYEQLQRCVMDSLPINRQTLINVPRLSDDGKIVDDEEGAEEFFGRQFREIFDGAEVEIVPGRDQRHDWLFANPNLIESFGALQEKSTALLKDKWTHLFVIAESGAWLFKPHIRECLDGKPERKILCLESSDCYLDEWTLYDETRKLVHRDQDQLQDGPQVRFAKLAWWKHNRHLTLAVDASRPAEPFIGAIYFRRRLKTSQISPVYVSRYHDCLELLMTFLSYSKRIVDEIDQLQKCLDDNSGESQPSQRRGQWTRDEKREFGTLLKTACEVARLVDERELSDRQVRLLSRLERACEDLQADE